MSVEKKRYEYKLTLGRGIDGKLIRKSFYSTKSKADARKKAEKYRLQYEMEHCVGGASCVREMKFEAWAVACLELYKKPFVTENTYSGTYLIPLENHLIPYFGQMNMDNIRPYHIQAYINQASQKYAPETVKKDYNVLSLIFQNAVDNQICTHNPIVKSIQLPKHEPVSGKRAYSQEQYDLIYSYAKNHRDGLAIMLLLETGISRSELLGLRWEDIDLEKQVIHINHGLVSYRSADEDKWVSAESGLKNKFRKRTVPIVEKSLLERLQLEPRKVELNGRLVETQQVIHSPQGKAYQPNNWVNRRYKPFMDELHAKYPEIPLLSVHELRHTRATLWIAQGVEPYMAARLLGHSDLKMLTKVYDHTDPETLRKALLNRNHDGMGTNGQ